MEKITIDDIAEALGVSKTTVSRAMSGKGRISEGTRQKVLDYAKEHDYKPNVMARGLAQQRTFNIAVVTPQESGSSELTFFHNCLVGITAGAEKAGYDVIITVEKGNRTYELEHIAMNNKADGVILTRTFFDDTRIAYLRENRIPYVVVGGSEENDVVQVDNDNYGGSFEMTQTLLQRGITRPALFGGDSEHLVTTQRLQGYLEALNQNGMDEGDELLFMDALDDETISSYIDQALDAGADCILCMDDDIADATLHLCRQKGIWIPQQISLASFYDSALLLKESPTVSAVSYDEKALGEMAADTLIRMIGGEEVSDITADTYQIELRESTL